MSTMLHYTSGKFNFELYQGDDERSQAELDTQEEVRQLKNSFKYRALLIQLNTRLGKELEVFAPLPPTATAHEVLDKLTEAKALLVVLNLKGLTKEEGCMQFSWLPDKAPVKEKMFLLARRELVDFTGVPYRADQPDKSRSFSSMAELREFLTAVVGVTLPPTVTQDSN